MNEQNDEMLEKLVDLLVKSNPHKISGNSQGGYDCSCGERWDWQRSEKAAAKRHAARFKARLLMAEGVGFLGAS